MVHVPYPGSMPAALALVTSGRAVDVFSPSTTLPIAHEGKVRVLAVAGPKRDPNVPDVPTLVESGLAGFESNTWFALMTSSKLPKDVLEKIRADAIRAMRAPDVQKRILDAGSTPIGNSADEFRKVILSDLETYRQIVSRMK